MYIQPKKLLHKKLLYIILYLYCISFLHKSTVSCIYAEYGFCNAELVATAHGEYRWNETRVQEMDTRSCRFGVKPEISGEKMAATRYCESHDSWSVYDGPACVTEVAYNIKLIAMASDSKI